MSVSESDAATLSTWVRGFFATVDARDVERTAAYYADDVRVAFGNGPVITGREKVARLFAERAGVFRAVCHDISGIWTGHDGAYRVVSVEAQVTYTHHDGRTITVPCTSTLRLRDARIADYRVFIDLAPVFATA
ncbi:nuclear transport factor 2 family protein [Nocardia sp. CA2R105]|uniref:nuclear transport factor 2 family protein n=1 Tax=Nocardia coffeae TaxID=2873381 RepID=UPI001CA6C01B|nr:nuclear transport factor 2 family protein [Nocardia coffeae]MBY8863447.1 nuclear transport factor 2 family protein [Nocardia coffeae]